MEKNKLHRTAWEVLKCQMTMTNWILILFDVAISVHKLPSYLPIIIFILMNLIVTVLTGIVFITMSVCAVSLLSPVIKS